MRVIVEADGGSRGNPGPAGYGAVVLDADSRDVLAERLDFVGHASNNVAEYSGLIAGLEAAAELGATDVTVQMDSKLVVEQMSGRWKVKHAAMIPLARRAQELRRRFESVTFRWIPREQNKHADRLANQAMDAGARGQAGSLERRPVELAAAQLVLGGDDAPATGSISATISFRAPAELRRRAEEVAEQRGVAVSELARQALEDLLAAAGASE